MRKTANKCSHFTVRVEIATLIYGGTTSSVPITLKNSERKNKTRPGLFFRIAAVDDVASSVKEVEVRQLLYLPLLMNEN